MQVALVDTDFHQFIDTNEMFKFSNHDLHTCVQPASLDIPISNTCYVVKDKILAFKCKVEDTLIQNVMSYSQFYAYGNKTEHILLKNHTYMVYCGYIELPFNIHASFSPKSSIGRIDVLVRTVVDYGEFYDCTEKGFKGHLWIQICPRSFNIVIKEGQCLTQMMLFETFLESEMTKYETINYESKSYPEISLYSSDEMLLTSKYHDNSQVLHLDVSQGFEALSTNEPVLLHRYDHNPEFFFKRIVPNQNKITLEKDKFYILATKEFISVPIELSGEMIPFAHHIGDLRSNKAGFFDSLFGSNLDGTKKGTIGVLEICPHETIIIFDGQPIALLKSFRNKSNPKIGYGYANNHYQSQTSPQLAKFFAQT